MADNQMTRRVAMLGAGAASVNDWSDSGGSMAIFTAPVLEAVTITFAGSGIAINAKTGEVTIPEGLSMSAASRAFWDGLHDAFPDMAWCKK